MRLVFQICDDLPPNLLGQTLTRSGDTATMSCDDPTFGVVPDDGNSNIIQFHPLDGWSELQADCFQVC